MKIDKKKCFQHQTEILNVITLSLRPTDTYLKLRLLPPPPFVTQLVVPSVALLCLQHSRVN